MSEIAASLTSPAWWFSAIVVALLINLVSAYAKPSVDTVLGKISAKRREKNDKARRAFDKQVENAAASSELLQLLIEDEFRDRLRSLTWLLFALIMGLQFLALQQIGTPAVAWGPKAYVELFLLVMSGLFLTASLFQWREVMRIAPVARAARVRRINATSLAERSDA